MREVFEEALNSGNPTMTSTMLARMLSKYTETDHRNWAKEPVEAEAQQRTKFRESGCNSTSCWGRVYGTLE